MNTLVSGGRSTLAAVLPGVVLTLMVAGAAAGVRQLEVMSPLSPVILAILLGILLANASGLPAGVEQGIAMCSKSLLRLAVMLLGCQITFVDLLAFGPSGLLAIVATVSLVLLASLGLGRLLRLDPTTGALIAAGTAVCGASAIAAVNSVLRGRDEVVSYAVGVITIFGTLGIFAYPLLRPVFGLSEAQYGLWVGLSLHEVAQVVAAGFAEGEAAGKVAVAIKLGRVLLLSAVVAGFAHLWFRRDRPEAGRPDSRGQTSRPPLAPWFLSGFLLLAALNSLGLVPAELRALLGWLTPMLMVVAMAGIGLATRLGRLVALGYRPLLLGAMATALISTLSLGFALLIG